MLKAAEIAGGIGFPHAVQVLRLTRTVTDRKTGKRHTETVYAVTSLSITDAAPTQIASWLRGHWAIENRLHWVRDVTYAEESGSRRESHPPAPTDPYVNLAVHTALVTLITRRRGQRWSRPSVRRTAGTAW